MELVINGNNNKWKDTYDIKANIRYLPYNKISNIIYTGKYNLLLNILNIGSLGARSLLEKTGQGEEDQLVISHGGALENAHGFLAMDYTPPKPNHPVHNKTNK